MNEEKSWRGSRSSSTDLSGATRAPQFTKSCYLSPHSVEFGKAGVDQPQLGSPHDSRRPQPSTLSGNAYQSLQVASVRLRMRELRDRMDKAGKALRRSGVRLRSRGSGHSDLNLIINQMKEVRNTYRGYVSAQATLARDLQRWACREDHRALQDSFASILELGCIWEDVQRGVSDKMREFRTHFEMVLEGEKAVDAARTKLTQCDQQEQKLKKELKRLAKRRDVSADEKKTLESRLMQAERQRDEAQLEFAEVVRENEAVKMIRVKNALLQLSDAFVSMGAKCQYIHQAQTTIAHQIPDTLLTGGDLDDVKYTGAGMVKLAVQEAKENVRQYDDARRPSVQRTSDMFPLRESPPPPYTQEPVRNPPEYSYACGDSPLRYDNIGTGEVRSRLPAFDASRSYGFHQYQGDEASALVLENSHSEYAAPDTPVRGLPARCDSFAGCSAAVEPPKVLAPKDFNRSKSWSWTKPKPAQNVSLKAHQMPPRLYPDLAAVMSTPDSRAGSGARCKSRLSTESTSSKGRKSNEPRTASGYSPSVATSSSKSPSTAGKTVESDPEDLSGAIGGLSFYDQQDPRK